jgi:hypothetical protein
VDESDNEAPAITPTKPSSMPRAEDDSVARDRSPEFRDRKAPESAQDDKARHPHSYE